MSNFIFKSREDLQKISQQLLTVLNNQRFLRNDISKITVALAKLTNDLNLQKQVDDYMESHDSEPPQDVEPD